MEKMDLSQMENLQGGWGKTEWCLTAVIIGVGGAMMTGVGAPVGVAAMVGAATALGC